MRNDKDNKTNIAIIGGPASGKTVVAGLLYEAVTIAKSGLIKEYDYYPSGEGNLTWTKKYDKKFDLEMGSDESSLKYLRDNIITPLRTGEFPAPTSPTELKLLNFNFRIPSIIGSRTRPIGIYEIGGEKVKRILSIITEAKDKGTILNSIKNEEVLSSLLQSEVIVVLANSELCIIPSSKDKKILKDKLSRQISADLDTAILLTAIKNYKQYMGTDIKGLGILFTMHDKVMTILPLDTKEQYENMIKESMRSTWTQFSYIRKNYKINNIKYFKSGLQTIHNEEEEKDEPAIPLRFYIRDYIDMMYWLINT